MERSDDQKTDRPVDVRQPYEPPQLRAVELLPDETLGVGCKVGGDVVCQNTQVIGS